MGKLLSRLICYSEAEQRQTRRPERQSQETIILTQLGSRSCIGIVSWLKQIANHNERS